MQKPALALLITGLIAGCNSDNASSVNETQTDRSRFDSTLKTATTYDDIADAALWQHPADASKHRLIVSLEEDGLAVFDPQGQEVFHDDQKEVLGADIRYQIEDTSGSTIDLLAVGLPDDEAIGFYAIQDSDSAPLQSLGSLSLNMEPSAVCLYKNVTTGELTVTAVSEDGDVAQYKLSLNNQHVSSRITDSEGNPIPVRQFNVGGELSACIIDDLTETLYIAEQDLGIWAYGADAENVKERRLVDSVDPLGHLQEIEGLELVYQANGKGYLLAADEGAGFVVYERSGDNTYLGTFHVNGIEEAKALAIATDALWLANTEADEPAYEKLPTDQLDKLFGLPDVHFQGMLSHRQLQVENVTLVAARGETREVDDDGDAADDPAFWLNPDDASQSLIIATNKQGGLMAYDLNGQEIQYLEGGQPNNVDLRLQVTHWDGSTLSLAAASNRELNTIALYQIRAAAVGVDPITPLAATGPFVHSEAAELVSNVDEVYGLCMYQSNDGTPYVFVNGKNGQIEQWQLALQADGIAGSIVRTLKVDSQPEGCVADDQTGLLYVGEEDRGIWQFNAEPGQSSEGILIAEVDNQWLVDDVEGLTLYDNGTVKYLIASSQGNNTYVVYDVNQSFKTIGSFAIIGDDEHGVDGATDTDGIDVVAANLGPDYPMGLFIAQDWYNIDSDYQLENQNFKLASWQDIIEGLSN